MALRWAASTFRDVETRFRRILGYRDLWVLKAILDDKHVDEEKESAGDDRARVVTHDFQLRLGQYLASLKPVHKMVGGRATSVTYPMFLRSSRGDLLFMYRRGSSGNGLNLVNVYDEKTRTWKRLLDKPLWDAERALRTRLENGESL
jgi:hypothetical protein